MQLAFIGVGKVTDASVVACGVVPHAQTDNIRTVVRRITTSNHLAIR